jgi:hypothetical protein
MSGCVGSTDIATDNRMVMIIIRCGNADLQAVLRGFRFPLRHSRCHPTSIFHVCDTPYTPTLCGLNGSAVELGMDRFRQTFDLPWTFIE